MLIGEIIQIKKIRTIQRLNKGKGGRGREKPQHQKKGRKSSSSKTQPKGGG